MTALADVTEDLAVAALAGYLATWLPGYLATWLPGYLATKAMELVGMRLYELESEKDRQREDAVGTPPRPSISL